MTANTIKTHNIYEKACASGFNKSQAGFLMNDLLDNLATRSDLKRHIDNLERDLKTDMSNLEVKLNHKIELSKQKLLRKIDSNLFKTVIYLGSMMTAICSIMTLIIKFL